MSKKASSLAGRALLAVVMMVGFYVLALGLCIALGWLCWMDAEEGSRVHPKLWIFAAVTIGVVLWSIWPRKDVFPDPGVPLTRREHPRLWQLVERVAERAEQEPPKQIFLVPEINAFVAERNSRMGFGGERIMGIGLPLLQVLTVPQVTGVIAHEFGHFHGGDTRLGPFIYRTRAAIGRTIVSLHEAESLLHKPFEWYGTLFLKVTFAISRAQEFAADALSVRIVGVAPVQSALRRVNEVGPLYDHYLESEYFPMLNRDIRPPLAEGFERFLASQAMQKAQVELGEGAMQAKGDPYDSHPPLSERLAAAAAVAGPGDAPTGGPAAIALLDDLGRLEQELLIFLTGRKEVCDIPAAAWADSGAALARGWQEIADKHAANLEPLRVAELATSAALLPRIAQAIDREIPEQQRVDAGSWFLGVFFANALARAGFVPRTMPGDPIQLVRDEQVIEPFATTRMLAEGKLAAADWAEACRRHGIGDLVLTGPGAAAC